VADKGRDSEYEKAGATFLSQQPDVVIKTEKTDPTWGPLKGHLETRLVAGRNWRQSWWTQNWSDLAQFILPRRSTWLTQSTGGNPNPNSMTRGRPINTAIADPTATYAVRVCASGLMSGLASPSRPWFKMVPGVKKFDIDAAARQWLDDTEDRIYTVIAGSNFYNSFAQECEDIIVFGSGPSIIYEDEKDLIRLYNPTVGEYFLFTDATGRIDGLYRLFLMTVAQIVGFFGIDNCPADIKEMWNTKGNSLEKEYQIAHAIEPNFYIDGAGKLPGNFTWREVYWVYGAASAMPLSQRGFIDQPFTSARWSVQSNDAYGRSVGMDVLPDVMQLQVMTKRMAEAIEKQVRPPLIGSMELKNKPTSTLPGHLTYVSNMGPGMGIRPIYEVNPDINAMAANIQQIEQRIQKGLFNDLFLMLESQPTSDRMTAYEVAQKMQEKLQVLGPVIESLLSDSLKPKLKRIYGILKRKGMIDPPPASLQGIPLDIEFVSMLALAQKGAATGGIERLMQLVGSMVSIYPTLKDNINSDAVVREYNDLLGNPQKILYGPEEVQGIRQQQAQQAQQEQQMQMMERGSQVASNLAPAAKVMADTPTTGGQDVLSHLIGGG
jgi:hypothetical protein